MGRRVERSAPPGVQAVGDGAGTIRDEVANIPYCVGPDGMQAAGRAMRAAAPAAKEVAVAVRGQNASRADDVRRIVTDVTSDEPAAWRRPSSWDPDFEQQWQDYRTGLRERGYRSWNP